MLAGFPLLEFLISDEIIVDEEIYFGAIVLRIADPIPL